jgi:hypothetical protein
MNSSLQGDMHMVDYEITTVCAPDRDAVKLLGATFEPGKPGKAEEGRWRPRLKGREEMLNYLKRNERYLYGEEGAFGSEKRKNPA